MLKVKFLTCSKLLIFLENNIIPHGLYSLKKLISFKFNLKLFIPNIIACVFKILFY